MHSRLHNFLAHRQRRPFLILLSLLCIISLSRTLTLGAAEKLVWKPLENAVLRIDDRAAKLWNVYHVDKKDQLLLVQLGRRFLMLDTREHQIYELNPMKLEHKDKDILWHESEKPAKPIETADWTVREVGPARRIRVKLVSEGRVLEVQVPVLDLRPVY